MNSTFARECSTIPPHTQSESICLMPELLAEEPVSCLQGAHHRDILRLSSISLNKFYPNLRTPNLIILQYVNGDNLQFPYVRGEFL